MRRYLTTWEAFLLLAAGTLFFIGDAHADPQYCVTSEKGTKMVTQCQNGTVTIVDDYEGKVIVCSAAAGDSPRCQTLPFKDAK